MAYFADLGSFSGPAVYLEAQKIHRPWRPSASMSVEARLEYARLLVDGHRTGEVPVGRALTACRVTQLYRTLLHEIGHQADYVRSVERPREGLARDDAAWDNVGEKYWRKSVQKKEAFAHRYAHELGEELRRLGFVPFDRNADPERLRGQGLDPAWFCS